MIIIENDISDKRLSMLIEALGVPIPFHNLTKLISDRINTAKYMKDGDSYVAEIIIDGNEAEEKFFNKLKLRINVSPSIYDSNAIYQPNNSIWNKNENLFDSSTITLNVNYDERNLRSQAMGMVSHELLHIYEDYKRRLKNVGFDVINPNKYSNNLIDLDVIRKKFTNKYQFMLANYMYYLLDLEKRGYIAQINQELRHKKYTDEDIKQGKYKELSYYKTYKQIKNVSGIILDSFNDEELNIFKEYVSATAVSKLVTADNSLFVSKMKKYFLDGAEFVLKCMHKTMVDLNRSSFFNGTQQNAKPSMKETLRLGEEFLQEMALKNESILNNGKKK